MIRKLHDIVDAFGIKLWWRMRTSSTMWGEYLKAKYIKDKHPREIQTRQMDSQIWTRIQKAGEIAEFFMAWKMGRGAISFWHDTWSEDSTMPVKYPIITIQFKSTFSIFAIVKVEWQKNN